VVRGLWSGACGQELVVRGLWSGACGQGLVVRGLRARAITGTAGRHNLQPPPGTKSRKGNWRGVGAGHRPTQARSFLQCRCLPEFSCARRGTAQLPLCLGLGRQHTHPHLTVSSSTLKLNSISTPHCVDD